MENKECIDCKEYKSLEEFFKSKTGFLGRMPYCKSCSKKRVEKWRQNNKEKEALTKRNWWKTNYQDVLKYNRKFRSENPDKEYRTKVKYRTKNSEKIRDKKNKERKEKPWLHRARTSRRRVRKLEASKLSRVFKDQILNVYKEAEEMYKNTGIKHNVDHIIPIYHDKVCGLHVPWNLQIMTFKDNRSKSNKFDGTYDNESWRRIYLTSQTN